MKTMTLRAAAAATSLAGSRTGSIGGSFDGMGDFLISDKQMLSRFGVTVVYPEKGEMASYLSEVDAAGYFDRYLDRITEPANAREG